MMELIDQAPLRIWRMLWNLFDKCDIVEVVDLFNL